MITDTFNVCPGAHCEVNIDECMSSPCLHNATCVDLVHGYACICSPGFTGEQVVFVYVGKEYFSMFLHEKNVYLQLIEAHHTRMEIFSNLLCCIPVVTITNQHCNVKLVSVKLIEDA